MRSQGVPPWSRPGRPGYLKGAIMSIFSIETSGLAINTYIIIDDQTKKAAVIDPTRNVQPIIDYVKNKGAEVVFILETHVHADFVSGAKELKAALNGKPIIGSSAMGGEEWVPKYTDKKIKDKDFFDLGSIKLQARHTPGHTPEHLMYVLYQNEIPTDAFTGDFLFVGSVGRPDLLGTEQLQKLSKELYNSIFNIVYSNLY